MYAETLDKSELWAIRLTSVAIDNVGCIYNIASSSKTFMICIKHLAAKLTHYNCYRDLKCQTYD